jgi:hypothetical protein
MSSSKNIKNTSNSKDKGKMGMEMTKMRMRIPKMERRMSKIIQQIIQ